MTKLSASLLFTLPFAMAGVMPGYDVSRRAAQEFAPGLPYDPNTTKNCSYWWDKEDDSYSFQDILDGHRLEINDFRSWVRDKTRKRFRNIYSR